MTKKMTSYKGITAMIFIVAILFLMPFASAFGETTKFDKDKPIKGQIDIVDNWGLPFISTKKADYTITSWTDQCLIDCSGEFLVNVYSSEKIFESLKFKDKKGIVETKEYQFYINDTESYESPIYSENCSMQMVGNESNQTEQKICESYQSGTETLTREIMKPYNFGVVNAGSYKVKLEAKKSAFESIDALPTAQGLELSEWAWWNSSWARKVPINLSTAAGYTGANYQISFNLTYDGDMNTDFSDLRFLNSTENGAVDYWIETKVDSAWALVWVEVPQNITTTNSSIYMYYKNALATTSTSNASATFIYGDDFSTNTTANYNISGGGTRVGNQEGKISQRED